MNHRNSEYIGKNDTDSDTTRRKEEQKEAYIALRSQINRVVADVLNLRKRIETQKMEAMQVNKETFCKDVIEVADSLQSLLERRSNEDPENPHVEALHEGLRLTEENMQKIFQKHGLARVVPEKERLSSDVYLTESNVPTSDGSLSTRYDSEGNDANFTKPGYVLNGQVLRQPARETIHGLEEQNESNGSKQKCFHHVQL